MVLRFAGDLLYHQCSIFLPSLGPIQAVGGGERLQCVGSWMGCVAKVAEPRIAAPPACRAGAPLRWALGSKLSLWTYSRVLPCLWRITALDAPICFLLRRPNRCQDRCSLRHSFPENLITCIIACIPHVTHHVQSSRDSRLSCFHEVSELLSQPPPVSIRKTYSHMHNSHAAQ